MLLLIGWIVFALECALAVVSGFVLSRFWSQATIRSGVRVRAVIVYAIGCAVILGFSLLLPL